MQIFRQFTFDSAHYLPNVPADHKCRNMHGHTYRMLVYLEGRVDQDGGGAGWVMDFSVIKSIIQPIIEEIDHRCLNEIPGLSNPTCEIITLWLWNRIKPQLPALAKIELHETPNSGCVYTGGDQI